MAFLTKSYFALVATASLVFAHQEPPPATPAAPPSQPKLVDIPLLDCSGLPCIEMTDGTGKALRLLLDTAEANSYLDTKAAQTLGLKLQPLKGHDGQAIAEVQQTVVQGAKLGELPMGDFPFIVLDTTQQPDKPNQKLEPLPGDGTLTYSAFKNRLLQIDSANHVVRISEPQDAAQPCPKSCTDLVIKHAGAHGPVTLTTHGFSINDQPVEVQLDTLFTGTMLVYPGSVQKLGLKKESKSKHKEFFPYVHAGVQLARADGATETYRDLQLLQSAPIYFMSNEEHPPDVQFDATVGSGLLSHAIVTFDFKGMHMWMEPATAPPNAPGDSARF